MLFVLKLIVSRLNFGLKGNPFLKFFVLAFFELVYDLFERALLREGLRDREQQLAFYVFQSSLQKYVGFEIIDLN